MGGALISSSHPGVTGSAKHSFVQTLYTGLVEIIVQQHDCELYCHAYICHTHAFPAKTLLHPSPALTCHPVI